MKRLLFILLLLPLFLQGQELITKNKKTVTTRYRQIPNNFTAWTAGTGSFTTVGANLPNGYIQCTSDGTAYISSTQAYGTWEFDLYKSGGGNAISVNFVSSINNITSDNGYRLSIASTEAINFIRRANAVQTVLSATNVSYISLSTWYSFRITRTSTGVFTTYIKGGTFGNEWTLISTLGGSGTNPITDNTYTTCAYLGIDMDSPDRIRNVRFLPLNQNKLSEIATRWRHIPNETSSFTVTAGSLTKVGTGTSAYLQAGATPTTAYFPYKQAYGTWEFDLYKGADANNTDICITSTANNISGNYYALSFRNNEAISLTRYASGLFGAYLTYTAIPYIQNTIWYSIRITRSSTGVFTTYIKGGTFGNEWAVINSTTSGTNPVTNNIITTSSFFVIDLDNGDAIRNIRFKSLPLWP